MGSFPVVYKSAGSPLVIGLGGLPVGYIKEQIHIRLKSYGFPVRLCGGLVIRVVWLFLWRVCKATEDPGFGTFYTKNMLLNERIRLWMSIHDQPHEKFSISVSGSTKR